MVKTKPTETQANQTPPHGATHETQPSYGVIVDRRSSKRKVSEPKKSWFAPEDLIQLKNLILGSKVNLLLILVPFGFISYYANWPPTALFFINFFGMIPLANILGDATECLSDHLGEVIGGLLNATFGNAVEIVVMIVALIKAKSYQDNGDDENRDKLLVVVQSSLIGSIFSNSLLVLGSSFIANGLKNDECYYNTAATSANVSLLVVASFVMILPGMYSSYSIHSQLIISRAAAFALLIMYGCLLAFVLKTHKHLLSGEDAEMYYNKPATIRQLTAVTQALSSKTPTPDHDDTIKTNIKNEQHSPVENRKPLEVAISRENEEVNMDKKDDDDDDDDDDDLEMSFGGSILLLLSSTVLVSLLSEYLVAGIEPMSTQLNMSESFIGVILLPIVGNVVEHLTSIRMAYKNKMDIAVSIAIGSAIQVAMFVVSLSVLFAWCLGVHLGLDFNQFEVQTFLYTSIIVFVLVSDGRSNWLEGAMLLSIYCLIGIGVWFQKFT